jgi:hypothetical protein
LFTLQCTHNFIVSWHVIPVAEGERDPFSMIFTHWSRAPSMVVFDNACHLYTYCISRCYPYWRNTVFAIDRHHEANHVACDPSFYVRTFADAVPDGLYSKLNSSVSEQNNSIIRFMGPSTSAMRYDNFISVIRARLHFMNLDRLGLPATDALYVRSSVKASTLRRPADRLERQGPRVWTEEEQGNMSAWLGSFSADDILPHREPRRRRVRERAEQQQQQQQQGMGSVAPTSGGGNSRGGITAERRDSGQAQAEAMGDHGGAVPRRGRGRPRKNSVASVPASADRV